MLHRLLLLAASVALGAQVPVPEAPAAKASAPRQAAAKAEVAKPAKPAKPKADRVLAWLGKTPVLESEFDLFVKMSVPEQQYAQLMMMPGAKEQYLKRYLEYRFLASSARLKGIQNTPDFAKKMKLMRMQVLVQGLFDKEGKALKEKSNVNDGDVKAYFDKHPEKFLNPETFSARHILVSTKAQGPEKPRTDEEAQARIKVIQEALKGGKSFEDAAKEFSDDPGSKDKGGLYEKIPFGRFVPEFEKAVRAQEPGKVGEPVKTMHGYHLIQVVKINPAAPQTFEEAKEAAKQQAAQDRQEAVMTEYFDAAKKATHFVEVKEPAKAPEPGDAAQAGKKPADAKKEGAK